MVRDRGSTAELLPLLLDRKRRMRKRARSIFVLALPYMFTVFLPIIAVFWLGKMVTDAYLEKIVTDKQKNIESAVERFYSKISNVKTLSYMIEENDIIVRYVYKSLRGEELSLVDNMEIMELLSNFLTNSDVAIMYLYDKSNHRIITPRTVYSNASDYFRFAYLLDGYLPTEGVERLDAFSKGYEFSPSMKVELYQKATEVIEYRLMLPFQISNNQLQLVLSMETEEILDDLLDVLEEGDELYLYDYQGNLIYGNGNQYEEMFPDDSTGGLRILEMDRQKVYGMVWQSGDRLWKMKIGLSNFSVRGGIDASTWYVWFLMGVSLVVSATLCAYFTFCNHREIQEILALFRKEEDSIVGYKVIKEYAGNLIAENDRMKEDTLRLKDARKYEVLDKLIRNTYEGPEESSKALGRESLLDGKCAVLCIRYKGVSYRTFVSENITVKDFTKSFLEEIIERKFEVFDTSSRETICVLYMDGRDLKGVAEDIVSRMNVEIAYCYKIDMEIGVGNMVDSIYQISESYQQARAVLRYRESSGKNVHLYSELVQLEDVYFYPKEYDEMISDYVIAGKGAEARGLIRKIYRENFEENERILTASASEAIEGKLRDLLILLAGKYEISIEDRLDMMQSKKSSMSFFQLVLETVDIITESIVSRKNDAKQHTALKIMQYINENYCDNMLSLKQISQALGLHENYISNLFSSQYGEPVSVVIEKRRMERACKLIKNTDMKISDIAEAVGYSSDVSFRRAFKKIRGMSPGEYRASGFADSAD